MSSATPSTPDAGQNVIAAAGGQAVHAVLGMSPRQQHLNYLWSFFTCNQYDARGTSWDGTPAGDPVEREAIATGTAIPGGFYDAAHSDTPLRLRRPTAPYHLVRVIVNRFTGLLFSERSHPTIRIAGNPDAEDFVAALAKQGRLWAAMIKARTYGGGQGTAVIGFKFVQGRLVFEVHDPRWCRPRFKDREQLVLSGLEKRYQYPMEVLNRETGLYETQFFWYRREITEQTDTLYKPVLVDPENPDPQWEVAVEVEHGLGEVPVVWLQNVPVDEEIDGEPDGHGVYDMSTEIDVLIAQANRGIVANCDPTLHIGTDLEMSEVQKGSDNAIKAEKGSTVAYVEINGAGIDAAYKAADKLRQLALEMAQCVLENPNDIQRTATEVERSYSSMIDKCDIMREQYGQAGVLAIMTKVVRAVRTLGVGRRDATGVLVRQQVKLPPRVVKDTDSGQAKSVPRVLPQDDFENAMDLQWPPYFKPSLLDKKTAAEGAAEARAAQLIDKEHAVKAVASYFDVDDTDEVMRKIDAEKQNDADSLGDSMLNRIQGMNASKIAAGDATAAPKVASAFGGDDEGGGAAGGKGGGPPGGNGPH